MAAAQLRRLLQASSTYKPLRLRVQPEGEGKPFLPLCWPWKERALQGTHTHTRDSPLLLFYRVSMAWKRKAPPLTLPTDSDRWQVPFKLRQGGGGGLVSKAHRRRRLRENWGAVLLSSNVEEKLKWCFLISGKRMTSRLQHIVLRVLLYHYSLPLTQLGVLYTPAGSGKAGSAGGCWKLSSLTTRMNLLTTPGSFVIVKTFRILTLKGRMGTLCLQGSSPWHCTLWEEEGGRRAGRREHLQASTKVNLDWKTATRKGTHTRGTSLQALTKQPGTGCSSQTRALQLPVGFIWTSAPELRPGIVGFWFWGSSPL